MNIAEATKKADNIHAIRRKSWPSESIMLVPTDSTFLTAIIFNRDVVNVRWEPSRSDLIADDWETCLNPDSNVDPLKLLREEKKQLKSEPSTNELLKEIIPDIKYIKERLTPMDRKEYYRRLQEITEDH